MISRRARIVPWLFSGSPAVVGNTRRPEALRPCLSAGLPFSVQCDLYQLTVLRQGIATQNLELKKSAVGKLTSLCQPEAETVGLASRTNLVLAPPRTGLIVHSRESKQLHRSPESLPKIAQAKRFENQHPRNPMGAV